VIRRRILGNRIIFPIFVDFHKNGIEIDWRTRMPAARKVIAVPCCRQKANSDWTSLSSLVAQPPGNEPIKTGIAGHAVAIDQTRLIRSAGRMVAEKGPDSSSTPDGNLWFVFDLPVFSSPGTRQTEAAENHWQMGKVA
jgi:hypothetical protein